MGRRGRKPIYVDKLPDQSAWDRGGVILVAVVVGTPILLLLLFR